jgi:hypothetical protein
MGSGSSIDLPRVDAESRWTALCEATRAAAEIGQPETLFDAVERALNQTIGHMLFTLLVLHEGGELERVYSNRPDIFPLKGRKAMGSTPWGAHVIGGRKPYLGRTVEEIRWAFYDHELIEGIGCGSVLNTLVNWDGRLLGVVNMLHKEYHYCEDDLAAAAPLAQALAPAILTLIDGG